MPKITITEPDKTPQPYRLKLDRSVTKIGRAQDNDVIISDGSASSRHCEIKRVEGGFILADSGSTNGIKYRDIKYSVIDLTDGLTIQIGDHIDLEFTLSEEEIAELSTENFESHQTASFPNSKDTASKDVIELKEARSKSKQANDAVDLEEAKPKNRPSASTKLRSAASTRIVQQPRRQAKKSNGGLSVLIFMILAVLCFLAGLAIRHYQEHQTFIFS